jgi:hypothetical protein
VVRQVTVALVRILNPTGDNGSASAVAFATAAYQSNVRAPPYMVDPQGVRFFGKRGVVVHVYSDIQTN